MSDAELAASNAATEELAPVASAPEPSPASEPQQETKAPSAREAIEKAMRTVEGQPRDEHGKWTKEQADREAAAKAAQPAATPANPVAPPADAQPAPAATAQPVIAPPARLSKEAQAEWDKAPPTVRAEVDRAFREMQNGIEQYQQRWEPLKQFDAMARGAGRDLPSVLDDYVTTEAAIVQNPVQGLAHLCQRLNIDPVKLGQALAGLPPSGGAAPEVAPLMARIAELEQQITGVSSTIRERDVSSMVANFAKDKPRFEELAEPIAQMLNTGFAKDLQDAYDKAERLYPPPPAPPAATPPAPRPQTPPRPTLQLSGSNSAPSYGEMKPANSTREAIRRAVERVGI